MFQTHVGGDEYNVKSVYYNFVLVFLKKAN